MIRYRVVGYDGVDYIEANNPNEAEAKYRDKHFALPEVDDSVYVMVDGDLEDIFSSVGFNSRGGDGPPD